MSAVTTTLAPLTWRGIAVPSSETTYEMAHNQAPRSYAYVAVEGHDDTGRQGLKVSATLHFLNTIEPGLYPDKWVKWRDAFMLDGSAGALVHPDVGEIDARPIGTSVTITAQSTAGITVVANWVETNVDVDTEADRNFAAPDADMGALAAAADASMAELDIEYPDGEPETSLEGAILSIEGRVTTAAQSVSGKMTQIKGTIDRISAAHTRAINAVSNSDAAIKDAVAGKPANWLLEAQLEMLRETLDAHIKIEKEKGRTTGIFRVVNAASLPDISEIVGNSLDDLLALNPELSAAPIVPSGAVVAFFKGL